MASSLRFTWGTSTSMLIVMRWNFSDVAEVVENTEDDQWLQMRYLVEREAVRATEIEHAAIFIRSFCFSARVLISLRWPGSCGDVLNIPQPRTASSPTIS